METLHVSTKKISFKYFAPFFKGPVKVRLSKSAIHNIKRSHKNLQSILSSGESVYGVNTGFGNLSHIPINNEDQSQLQINLVRSHASGIGEYLEPSIVRVILFLKLLTYAHGYSGVRLSLANKIVQFINKDIIPVIPKRGSVGASGDLAPLGHMALALIGEGEVFHNGKKYKTKNILKKYGINALKLGPKEGLSLINGTQVSTALAIDACLKGERCLKTADIVGALSVENSLSSRSVFKANIHKLKMHPGQRQSAKNVYKILTGSQIVESHKTCETVQDPYSFRCIPHVHGACRDMFSSASNVINNEINSVSDNPLIMNEKNVSTSGHFHAEHIAQALDTIAISFSEIGAISERRVHYFMKGIGKQIPPFVTEDPGVQSGYMIAHVTASALASENKTLSHPASVDSLPTSGGQEDLVSMAPWSAFKLDKIYENIVFILAIELIVAGAANNIGMVGLTPGKGTRPVLDLLNKNCDYVKGDRPLTSEIEKISGLINSGSIINVVSNYLILE